MSDHPFHRRHPGWTVAGLWVGVILLAATSTILASHFLPAAVASLAGILGIAFAINVWMACDQAWFPSMPPEFTESGGLLTLAARPETSKRPDELRQVIEWVGSEEDVFDLIWADGTRWTIHSSSLDSTRPMLEGLLQRHGLSSIKIERRALLFRDAEFAAA